MKALYACIQGCEFPSQNAPDALMTKVVHFGNCLNISLTICQCLIKYRPPESRGTLGMTGATCSGTLSTPAAPISSRYPPLLGGEPRTLSYIVVVADNHLSLESSTDERPSLLLPDCCISAWWTLPAPRSPAPLSSLRSRSELPSSARLLFPVAFVCSFPPVIRAVHSSPFAAASFHARPKLSPASSTTSSCTISVYYIVRL